MPTLLTLVNYDHVKKASLLYLATAVNYGRKIFNKLVTGQPKKIDPKDEKEDDFGVT
jgi:hypothetical protein